MPHPPRTPRRTRRLLALLTALLLALIPAAPAAALAALPEVGSEAALLLHPDTGLVLYAKNADRQLPASSLVKLMTALITVERIRDLSTEVTVSAAAVADLSGLSTANLKEGEVLTVEQLLYCLLLPSAGDAANALAEAVAGDVPSFVALMNEKAAELGMKNTHFVNPHGRDDDLQYTTASDMAKLSRSVMKNQTLSDMVSMQYKRIAATNLTGDRYYFSNNALVVSSADRRRNEDYYYRHAGGLMTGSSAAAGYNLAAHAEKGGFELITVLLGAPRESADGKKQHYVDAITLMNWAYENLQYTLVLGAQQPVCEVEVTLSSAKDSVALVAEQDIYAVVPAGVKTEELHRMWDLPESVEAPVDKGEVLGEAVISYDGARYVTFPLVAQSAVERSLLLLALHRIAAFFSGKVLRVLLLLAVLAGIGYLALLAYVNKKRAERRRRKKQKRYR